MNRGMDKHLRRLRRLSGTAAERAVGKALFAGGEQIQVEAQLSITRGAVSGANHVASRPGEPPNNDQGDLVAGIETTQPKTLLVEVSSSAGHAAPLEFGTSRMAARPYMRPARDNNIKEVQKSVAAAIDRVSRSTR